MPNKTGMEFWGDFEPHPSAPPAERGTASTSPTHIVEFFDDGGELAENEATVCFSDADMLARGYDLIAHWPRIRVWSLEAGPRDMTEDALRLIAAEYERDGYTHDTIPHALIDHASADLQSAHAAACYAQALDRARHEDAA